MRFVSFGIRGDRVGVVVGNSELVEITELIPNADTLCVSPMRRLIAQGPGLLSEIADFVDQGVAIPLGGLALVAPIPDPSKIIAAPVNYIDHMEEMSQDAHIDSLGVFLKAPSSLVGPGATVLLPYSDRRIDQEGELCFVISEMAHNVSVNDAFDYIFGYSCLLDITMRGGEDRSTRKSFDTFTPMGPELVTADEIRDPRELELSCWVSGVLRQRAQISDLIWGIPQLVSYISSVMTLYPGDVITTGTPAGVGPIIDGDTVVVEISKIGALEVEVSSAGAGLSVTKGAGRGPVPPIH